MKVNGTSMIGNDAPNSDAPDSDAPDMGDSSMCAVQMWIASLDRKPISQGNGFAVCAKPATLGR
jgi:hypothetical protein